MYFILFQCEIYYNMTSLSRVGVTLHYTVNHKKHDILFLTITLANRFLQFLCHFNHEEILHATVIKPITSLDLCAHLTWKN